MRRQNGPNQSSLPRLCESRKWIFMLYMLESNDLYVCRILIFLNMLIRTHYWWIFFGPNDNELVENMVMNNLYMAGGRCCKHPQILI